MAKRKDKKGKHKALPRAPQPRLVSTTVVAERESPPNRQIERATPYLGRPRAPRMLSGARATFGDALARVRQQQGVVDQSDPLRVWYDLDLDAESLSKLAPAKLLELMTDVSPDISRAMWDFLRMCNPGWEADAID